MMAVIVILVVVVVVCCSSRSSSSSSRSSGSGGGSRSRSSNSSSSVSQRFIKSRCKAKGEIIVAWSIVYLLKNASDRNFSSHRRISINQGHMGNKGASVRVFILAMNCYQRRVTTRIEMYYLQRQILYISLCHYLKFNLQATRNQEQANFLLLLPLLLLSLSLYLLSHVLDSLNFI